jgi:fructose/tagatose bisphosphate aldolase
VDTDGRLTMPGAIGKYLSENPDTPDTRTYFGAAREAVYQTVKGKMIDLGTAGYTGVYFIYLSPINYVF